jgi:hypothetical protein
MAIKDYSTDPDLNVQISGINIAEGCPPSGINNAIRQLMADVKVEKDTRDAEQAAKDAAQDAAIAEASKEVTELDTALRQLIVEELAKYLPLEGGTMTGALYVPAGGSLSELNDDDYKAIILNGDGVGGIGSELLLFKKDSPENPGQAWLRVFDTTKGFTTLKLSPSGSVSVDNRPIVQLNASWHDGYNWYRKYYDGWIEQGGVITFVGTQAGAAQMVQQNFFTPFSNANYTLVVTPAQNPNNSDQYSGYYVFYTDSHTSTSFIINSTGFNKSQTITSFAWYACGY